MIKQVYISYFYQIRFFTPNYIPLSTAVYDPKWYHSNCGQDYVYKDKNGVVNGLRINPLHPEPHNDECVGCDKKIGPENCSFIRLYKEQLGRINFGEFMVKLNQYMDKINTLYLQYPSATTLIPVFIVHEAPNNPCSERWPLFEWFNEHGIKCEEWSKQ